ncbi:MAG: hypothetical protein JW958_11335 [Candidatus Eisenbacteria bacterium]|nr:hypothetical protein [Candidatus Eisenbacteria bacterium]
MLSDGMDIPANPLRTEPIRRVLPSRSKEREEHSREEFRELVEGEKDHEEEKGGDTQEPTPSAAEPEEKKGETADRPPPPPRRGDRLDLLV